MHARLVFVCPCVGTVYVGIVLFLFGHFDSTVAERTRIHCGVGRCSVQPLANEREAQYHTNLALSSVTMS